MGLCWGCPGSYRNSTEVGGFAEKGWTGFNGRVPPDTEGGVCSDRIRSNFVSQGVGAAHLLRERPGQSSDPCVGRYTNHAFAAATVIVMCSGLDRGHHKSVCLWLQDWFLCINSSLNTASTAIGRGDHVARCVKFDVHPILSIWPGFGHPQIPRNWPVGYALRRPIGSMVAVSLLSHRCQSHFCL